MGIMLVLMAGMWIVAHAAVPDPTKTIVTGVYWAPHPDSAEASSVYDYQHIADAGIDLIITIQNARDFASQSAMIEQAAGTRMSFVM